MDVVSSVDPDRACPHAEFTAAVQVTRMVDSLEPGAAAEGYSASVWVQCRVCGEPFRWIGVPAGVLADRPACSVDETELRAPLRPASADPDFGLGLPGFAVRYRD